jgi:hypothetical protein
LRYFSLAFTEGFTEDALNQEKQEMAAVENRNGEQVEDPQIDAQDGDEEDHT